MNAPQTLGRGGGAVRDADVLETTLRQGGGIAGAQGLGADQDDGAVVGVGLGFITWTHPQGNLISVRLIQGNVPQAENFDGSRVAAMMRQYQDGEIDGETYSRLMMELTTSDQD